MSGGEGADLARRREDSPCRTAPMQPGGDARTRWLCRWSSIPQLWNRLRQDARIPAEASAARGCRDAPRRAVSYGRAQHWTRRPRSPRGRAGDVSRQLPHRGRVALAGQQPVSRSRSRERSCSSFSESTTIRGSGRRTTSSRRWRVSSPRSGATGSSRRGLPSPDRSLRFSRVAAGSCEHTATIWR